MLFAYRTITVFGQPFLNCSAKNLLGNSVSEPSLCHAESHDSHITKPTGSIWYGFGLFPVRSPLLGKSRLFSFPGGTKMFQFPSLASCAYEFSAGYCRITGNGLPHWGIAGSRVVCTSPALIAACHALHRLSVPRHPPYALSSLTWKSILRKKRKKVQISKVTRNRNARLPICQRTVLPQERQWK